MTSISNKNSSEITFFTSSMGDGGAQRTIANLAKGFAERDYNVELLLLRAEGAYLQQLPDSIAITELNSGRALQAVPEIYTYLRQKNPEVFFSTIEYLNVAALLSTLLSRTSTQTVIRAANIQTKQNKGGIQSKFQYSLAKILYPQADKIISLSHHVKRDISTHYGLNPDSISVIHNPVDIEEIKCKAAEEINCDVFDSDTEVAINVGSLTEQKDIPTTIKAFAQLVDQRDIELIILGKGNQRDHILQLTKNLGVDDRVHLLGFVDNPFAYMDMADVFVLSSRWEGFGHVIVEAMACGTPVVATNCPGGPSEILDDNKYGELIPVGDHMALASAIRRTLDNPPDESTLVNRSKDFNYKQITDQYEKAIFNL